MIKAIVFFSNYYCSEPLETLQALQAFVAKKEEEEEDVVLSCTNLSQLILINPKVVPTALLFMSHLACIMAA